MYDSHGEYIEILPDTQNVYWWIISIDGEEHLKTFGNECEALEVCGLIKNDLGKEFVIEYEKAI